jgi:hypothetical protein
VLRDAERPNEERIRTIRSFAVFVFFLANRGARMR